MEVLRFLWRAGPGRSVLKPSFPGVLAGCLAVSLGACQAAPATRSDLAVDTAEIVLGGRGSEEHVVPSRVVVRSGGEVVFRTVDNRVHTIAFEPDSMGPAPLEFLRSTRQMRSPPLVSRGTLYRISLEGAPPGYYPFWATGPGPPVLGALFVE